jgi:hypothetical protein
MTVRTRSNKAARHTGIRGAKLGREPSTHPQYSAEPRKRPGGAPVTDRNLRMKWD